MNAALRGPMGLIQLDNSVLSIGRSRQNRLVVNNPQISTKHAEVKPLGDGRYQVVDLESRNGTRVNGLRLTAGVPQLLNVGDTLLLGGPGGVELTFELSAAASPGLVKPAAQPGINQPAPDWAGEELPTQTGADEGYRPPPLAAPVPMPPIPPVQAPPPAAPFAFSPPAQPPAPAGYGAAAPGAFSPPAQPPTPAAYGTAQEAMRVALPPRPPAPAPAALPPAITNVRRYRRPSKVWLIGGCALLVVLMIAGIALGAKVIGHPTATKASSGGSSTSTPKPTAVPAVIQTATVTVQGQPTTVLTDTGGFTLYYFKPDTATTTACTGACIAKWPPLLFRGSGTPTASTTLPGKLSIITSANGSQVAYNLHQLYRFSGDSAPGQANGEGKAGKWFVVTPDLPVNGSTPALIQTASVTINGTPTTVLTTAQGFTLYYFTPDTAATAACTGGCTTTWPPLLFTGSGTPTASTSLPGTLSVQMTANGPQVEYQGHELYTFKGDTAPGQTNGQGKGGKWFVVTPTLSSNN